ncbi:MAG: tRNA (guanine(46)-N(7))-methyltransferase TrmB [Pseudomonadota bacterium]
MPKPLEPRDDGAPWRNFHGRRHGKKLRQGQADHLRDTLPRVCVPGVAWSENPERAPIDLDALFGGPREVWLEIGFGGGEHLLAQALANPDVGLIGAEPFVNGVAVHLAAMERAGAGNIRLHAGDARDLLEVLPEASVARAFVLYPDPWPKTRHHKRRFINPDNLDALARVLKPGAHLRVASDIPDYIRHALEAAHPRDDFAWTAERPADWRQAWPDWPGTRYEAKALREGRTPGYLTFQRL